MLPSRCWSPPVVGRRPGACGDVRVGWQPWAPHSGLCRASEREEPRLSMPKDDDPDRGRVLLCLGPDSSRWDGWPAPVSLIGPTGPAHRIFNSEKGIVDANSGNNQLPRAWIFLSITEFFPSCSLSFPWVEGGGGNSKLVLLDDLSVVSEKCIADRLPAVYRVHLLFHY